MIEALAGLIAIIVGLFLKIKWDSSKIDNLESENIMYQKKSRIIDEIKKGEKEIEAKKDEDLESINDSDWINRI